MRTILKAAIAVFLLSGIVAGAYAFVNEGASDKETFSVETESSQDWYPDEIRTGGKNKDDQDEKPDLGAIEEYKEEELRPDEDFQEFEIEDEEDEVADDVIPDEEQIVVNYPNVNLRESDSMQATVLEKIPKGTTGRLLENGKYWALVEFNGTTGYMGPEYLVIKSENPTEFQRLVDEAAAQTP